MTKLLNVVALFLCGISPVLADIVPSVLFANLPHEMKLSFVNDIEHMQPVFVDRSWAPPDWGTGLHPLEGTLCIPRTPFFRQSISAPVH